MAGRHVLSPALERRLEGATGPLLVVVTFRAAPPAEVLKQFGLDALPKQQATGPLQPEAIHRLAKHADVRTIDLSPAATAATIATNPKLDSNLSALLADAAEDVYAVAVTFRTPPSAETVRAAGLVATAPDSTIASGRLSKRAILELAGRDDVVYVQYQRPPQPSVN
jgi:hypothetical protein